MDLLTFEKKMIFTESQLIQTFTESKDSTDNCFILYFEQKNVFNVSDLIFTGSKCHPLLFFLEQWILSKCSILNY